MKRVISFASALFLAATVAQAAISFGPTGSATYTFDVKPPTSEFSQRFIAGGGADIDNDAELEAEVQLLDAATLINALRTSGTVPPSANSTSTWNSAGMYLQTRPTGNRFTTLLATLQNDSGAAVSTLSVTYDFNVIQATATAINEEVPGQRAFWSLSGAPGSWQPIPEASLSTPGTVVANLNVGSWAVGAPLYVFWADDNANLPGGTDAEGAYTIDNLVFGTGANGVRITSPSDGSTFAQGVNITINVAATLPGTVTSVSFFENGNLIGSDTSAPYSVVYSNATLGVHGLTASATDDQANTLTSDTVEITVLVNNPPSVTITNPPDGQMVLVGSNVTVRAAATDSDGMVARVEFYVDGGLYFTDTTSAYSFDLGDILVGTHSVTAVAVDNAGARATNTISITATNPPVTVLLPNGSAWKYLDDGTDQGSDWTAEGFNDSGWSNGVAELGYGDIAQNRPERTVVGFGPQSTNKYITTYFRTTFNVADVSTLGTLSVNLLADDGGVVYINGVEVFRDNMGAGTVTNRTPAASVKPDDGTIYTNGTASASVLHNGVNTIAVEIHQDSIASSDISFDLMLWAGAPSGPTLHIRRLTDTTAEISWVEPSTGYILQSSPNLSSPVWTTAPEPDVPSGGFHRVIVASNSGMRYFRLIKP